MSQKVKSRVLCRYLYNMRENKCPQFPPPVCRSGPYKSKAQARCACTSAVSTRWLLLASTLFSLPFVVAALKPPEIVGFRGKATLCLIFVAVTLLCLWWCRELLIDYAGEGAAAESFCPGEAASSEPLLSTSVCNTGVLGIFNSARTQLLNPLST